MIWSGSVAYVDKTLGPLKQGDEVECEIEKVGMLRSKVV
jgi:2-keto-4-pentenoate hydratase/2-oxohepta-3-ene-1,7-dioic acid hydratase in catechol pathway